MTVVRTQPQPPLQAFVAWGFVLGERLPDQADIGGVRIARVSGDRLTELRRSRPVLKHADSPSFFSSSVPPDSIVKSEWSIWIRVDAETDDEALDRIGATLLPPALTALEVVSYRPVVVELLRIGVEDETGRLSETKSPFSLPITVSLYDPIVLDTSEIAAADEVATRVSKSSTLLSAARAFFEADRMQSTSGGIPAAVAAALLRYFHVIETVSTAIQVSEPPDADQRRDEIVSRLSRGLASKGSTRNKVAQIRNTATDLNRFESAFLTLKIENAAAVLGVATDQLTAALELAKLRNTRLSHPGGPIGELGSHIEPSRAAAKAFLIGGVAARL